MVVVVVVVIVLVQAFITWRMTAQRNTIHGTSSLL